MYCIHRRRYVYIYMYIYLYVCVCTGVCMRMHVCVCEYVCMPMLINTLIQTILYLQISQPKSGLINFLH